MTSVTRNDFIARLDTTPLPVAAMQAAARLEGVDVARADENKDGVVRGPQEAAALWDSISARDTVSTTAEQRCLLGRTRTVPTPEGQRLGAVESFRLHAVRTAEIAARGDRFGRDGVVEGGPARGEPVDTTKARPAVTLDPAAKAEACRKAGVDPATIEHAFANLYDLRQALPGAGKALRLERAAPPAPGQRDRRCGRGGGGGAIDVRRSVNRPSHDGCLLVAKGWNGSLSSSSRVGDRGFRDRPGTNEAAA